VTERRFNPMTGAWVTVDPHTALAPGPGGCAVCAALGPDIRPGPAGAPGGNGPDGSIAVFATGGPAPLPVPRTATDDRPSPLHRVEPAAGLAEVVAYTSAHGRTLADQPVEHLARLVEVWADRYAAMGDRPDTAYVFIAETARGGPGEHACCRVQGFPDIPPAAARELHTAAAHMVAAGTCVLCDVVDAETADPVRVVTASGAFVAFTPFAARFPYELHIAARRHATSVLDLSDPERDELAGVLQAAVSALGAVSGGPPAYELAVHQAPTQDESWLPVSHLHLEIVPLAGAGSGFPVGEALGTGAYVNDRTPEQAAAELRAALAGR
jgi:UDPglucose--hexose-1-phosphate uridylyltransferase